MLQLELYLSGRAEQVYEVLTTSTKDLFSRAIDSLKKRLQPVANETLLSSQLMKSKQRTGESVSTYLIHQDSLQKEVDHLARILKQNGYPATLSAMLLPHPHRKQQMQAAMMME